MMGRFTPEQIADLERGRFDSFTAEHRLWRSPGGKTLVHFLLQKGHWFGLSRASREEVAARLHVWQAPLYVFDLSYRGPIDIAIAERRLDVAELLLQQPIGLDTAALNYFLSAVRACYQRDRTRSPEIWQHHLGEFASLLCGVNIHRLFNANNGQLRKKYEAHLNWRGGCLFEGDVRVDLEGFAFATEFLPLRIRSLLDIWVRAHVGETADLDLPLLSEQGATETPQAFAWRQRQQLVQALVAELQRNLQTYWIDRYGALIKAQGETERVALRWALTQGIVKTIQQLPLTSSHNSSLVMEAGAINHSVYWRATRIADNEWQLWIHNLGAGIAWHEREGERVFPYALSGVNASGWAVGASVETSGVGVRYLQAVVSRLFQEPHAKWAQWQPLLYDKVTVNALSHTRLVGAGVFPLAARTQTPHPWQRVGNCVVANLDDTRHALLGNVMGFWLDYRERAVNTAIRGDTSFSQLTLTEWPILEIVVELPDPVGREVWEPRPLGEHQLRLQHYYQQDWATVEVNGRRLPTVAVTLSKREHPWSEASGLRDHRYDIHENIPLSSWVKQRGQRFLIGHAGSGKSTLLRTIAYAWSYGELTDYAQVIWISLRELYARVGLLQGGSPAEQLTDFIYKTLWQEQRLPVELERAGVLLWTQPTGCLWLIDGWDEAAEFLLSAATPGSHSERFKNIVHLLQQQPEWIISSRPAYLNTLFHTEKTPYVEMRGFSEEQMLRYVSAFAYSCWADKIQQGLFEKRVLEFRAQPIIWQLLHSPLLLQMACLVCENESVAVESIQTVTDLYTAFTKACRDRHQSEGRFPPALPPLLRPFHELTLMAQLTYRTQLEQARNRAWQPLEAAMATLAFQALCDGGRIEVTSEELGQVRALLEAQDPTRPWTQELIGLELLEGLHNHLPGEFSHSRAFLHLRFRDYYAALHLSTLLRSPGYISVEEWVIAHRYNPQWEMVWIFVAGIVAKDADPMVLDRFLTLMVMEGRQPTLRDTALMVKLFNETRCRRDGRWGRSFWQFCQTLWEPGNLSFAEYRLLGRVVSQECAVIVTQGFLEPMLNKLQHSIAETLARQELPEEDLLLLVDLLPQRDSARLAVVLAGLDHITRNAEAKWQQLHAAHTRRILWKMAAVTVGVAVAVPLTGMVAHYWRTTRIYGGMNHAGLPHRALADSVSGLLISASTATVGALGLNAQMSPRHFEHRQNSALLRELLYALSATRKVPLNDWVHRLENIAMLGGACTRIAALNLCMVLSKEARRVKINNLIESIEGRICRYPLTRWWWRGFAPLQDRYVYHEHDSTQAKHWQTTEPQQSNVGYGVDDAFIIDILLLGYLAETQDSRVVPLLRRVYEQDVAGVVKHYAFEALMQVEGVTQAELFQALHNADTPGERQRILRALAHHTLTPEQQTLVAAYQPQQQEIPAAVGEDYDAWNASLTQPALAFPIDPGAKLISLLETQGYIAWCSERDGSPDYKAEEGRVRLWRETSLPEKVAQAEEYFSEHLSPEVALVIWQAYGENSTTAQPFNQQAANTSS